MPTSPGDLIRIRSAISGALDRLHRAGSGRSWPSISDDLAPCADAIADLLAGGKRLRPAFCYWGWRACGGPDGPPIMAAAAALELLHASALVHDDVMDGSDTRRGQPSVHKRFEAGHVADQWLGEPARFGTGAAILIGDLLLAWTDEMLRTSGLPADSVWRGLSVLDSMRTEVLAGQFLDLVAQSSGSSEVATSAARGHLQVSQVHGRTPAPARRRPPRRPVPADSTRPSGPRSPATGSRSASRSSSATTYSACSATRARPASRSSTTCGKASAPCCWPWPGSGPTRTQAAVLDRCVGDPALTERAAGQVREVITDTGALAECEQMISVNLKEALSALDGAPITAEAKSALADLAIAATARAG